jgi:glycosyltransferase involved in cell wall biosynthesis
MLMTAGQGSQTRVCFVSPAILPLFGIAAESEFGGAEVQVYSLARYLQREGFQVDVLTSTRLGKEPKVVDGIRLIPAVDDVSTGKPLSKIGLLKALRRSRADVHIGTCAGPDIGLIALCARLSGKRFVYRVSHEIDCDGTFESRHGWRGRLFGLGLRLADAVVAQHEDQRRLLAERGVPAEVIRNGFDFSAASARGERDIDCLWVGRCDTWKRPELLLDLARALPHRKFVMICPPSRDRDELFEEIRSKASGIANLTFVERVTFEVSQSWFERAKLFVGTSDAEGFPNTYIQACAAGTPIATLKVDPERFVEFNKAGFVAHGDPSRLTEGVDRLLSDPKGWGQCSDNVLAYARTNHDLEIQGAKWTGLLRFHQERLIGRR